MWLPQMECPKVVITHNITWHPKVAIAHNITWHPKVAKANNDIWHSKATKSNNIIMNVFYTFIFSSIFLFSIL
jgi:hypothetical protein